MLLRSRWAAPSGFIEPCLPSRADRPPSGLGWIHEIKHDGFRLMVRRDPAGVRLLTRNGIDWTERFPNHCGRRLIRAGRQTRFFPGARIRRCGGAGADREPTAATMVASLSAAAFLRLLINAAVSAITAAMKFVRRQQT